MKKEELRNKIKDLRKEISSQDVEERSRLITERYFDEIFNEQVERVHCFLPIPGKGEVDTWLIINKLWEKKVEVITSVSDFSTYEMKNYILEPDVEIISNNWGIPEPHEAVSSFEVPDHILIPLLTFDKKGHRVGYGKGFYDRFLQRFPSAEKIGLSLFDGVDEIEDVNEHDQPLDVCLTPESQFVFKSS